MLSLEYSCSIVIPTYNRSELIGNTLRSIVANHIPREDYEIIVVDDGSRDDTASAVKSFENLANVKYVYQPDKGFRVARARNLGISLAEGDVCLFVDAGVLVNRSFISKHVEAHGRVPHSICLGPLLGIYSPTPEDLEWLKSCDPEHVDNYVAQVSENDNLKDPRQVCFDTCKGDLNALPMPWAIAWTANLSAPRKDILAIGGFDENYTSWGVEDLDLALSLFRNNSTFTLEPEAVAIHVPHEIAESITQSNLLNKRYLHNKFNMLETEIYMTNSSLVLNSQLTLPKGE